jgi:hypothetical protein
MPTPVIGNPVVSLVPRSTTGYTLGSLWLPGFTGVARWVLFRFFL